MMPESRALSTSHFTDAPRSSSTSTQTAPPAGTDYLGILNELRGDEPVIAELAKYVVPESPARPRSKSAPRNAMRRPFDSETLWSQIAPRLRIVSGPDAKNEVLSWCIYHADGQGPKPAGKAHRPNLCINLTDGIFVCRACGERGTLLNLAEQLGVVGRGRRSAETVFQYRDEQSNLIFEVHRVDRPDGKRLWQRHPDGQGGWINTLKGVRRVLYRLPELIASPADSIVWIAEGEKCADRLAREGLVATTNPGGAGKWRPEFSEPLRGRDVVILPDCDDTGRKHAREVAASIAGVARSVKVVELPGLTEKQDIVEWLDKYKHTVDELRALASAAPTLTSETLLRSAENTPDIGEDLPDGVSPPSAADVLQRIETDVLRLHGIDDPGAEKSLRSILAEIEPVGPCEGSASERDALRRTLRGLGIGRELLDAVTGVPDTAARGSEETLAEALLRLAAPAVLLFDPTADAAIAAIPVEKREASGSVVPEHVEMHPVASAAFRGWLRLLAEVETFVPGADAVNSALDTLAARARFRGPRVTLANRSAMHDGALWVDLADDGWRAVRIDAHGWSVVDRPPPLFRRYPHQRPILPGAPSDDVDLPELLRPFAPLKDDDLLLLTVWIVAALLPHIPRPLLVISGGDGTGKTTLARVVRRIVDPSVALTLALSDDLKELAQTLAHHAVAAFDNVSRIGTEVSDVLCRAATGEGFTKRKLYTDEEDLVFAYKRAIVITSIAPAAENPDLLSRCLSVEVTGIRERMTERDLDAQLSAVLPQIVATLFSILARAAALRTSIELPRPYPRMADFFIEGGAIAAAMGYPMRVWSAIYRRDEKSRLENAIEANPLARAVLDLVSPPMSPEYTESTTELFARLTARAIQGHLVEVDRGGYGDPPRVRRGQRWPGNAAHLTRMLLGLRRVLGDAGVEIGQVDLEGHRRGWRIIYGGKSSQEVEGDEGDEGR